MLNHIMRAALVVLVGLLAWSPVAFAQVVFDASSTPGEATSTTVSSSITVGAGANRLLIACLVINGVNGTGITFDTTQNMVFVDQQIDAASTRRVEMWQLVNPNSGTHNMIATIGGSQNVILMGKSFSGVDQTTPVGTQAKTNTGGAATAVSTTVTSTGMVVDCLQTAVSASAHAADAGQTQAVVYQGTGGNIDSASSIEAASGSVTSGWSWVTAAGVAYILAPLNAAAVVGATPRNLMLLGVGP